MSCSDVDIEEYLHQNTLLSKMRIKSRPDSSFTSQMAATVGSSDEYNYEQ